MGKARYFRASSLFEIREALACSVTLHSPTNCRRGSARCSRGGYSSWPFGVGYEVVARYLFRAPTPWAFDLSYMLYGTIFMMAGAYTLSRDGHVRGDFIYRSGNRAPG